MTGQSQRIFLAFIAMLTVLLSTSRVASVAFAAADDHLAATTPDANTIEPTGELTRSQALTLVLAHSPQLRVYSLDIRIADARKLQAYLLPNPELGVEFENLGGTGDISGFRGAETTVSVSQPIETAGKRAKRVAAASADRRVAEADYRLKRSDVLARADKAFHELLAAQQRYDLTAEQVDLARKLHETVSRRVSAGKDPAVESTRSAIELADAQLQLTDAATTLDSARRDLSLLWGGSDPRFSRAIADEFEPADPPALNRLHPLAMQHPSVTRWTDEITAATARLRLAKARSTPDLAITGGYRRLEADSDNAFVIGLAIPLPVFDRNKAGRLEATYELARVHEHAALARTEMLARLASARTRLTAAAQRARVLRDSILPDATTAYTGTLTGYEQGKFDYLNVLDAQRTLFDVRHKAVAATLEYHQARADLEAIIDCPLSSVIESPDITVSSASSETDSNER